MHPVQVVGTQSLPLGTYNMKLPGGQRVRGIHRESNDGLVFNESQISGPSIGSSLQCPPLKPPVFPLVTIAKARCWELRDRMVGGCTQTPYDLPPVSKFFTRRCHSSLPVGPSGKADDDDDGADDDKTRRRVIFSSSSHLLLSLDWSSFFNRSTCQAVRTNPLPERVAVAVTITRQLPTYSIYT